ncbi:toxin [Rhizobium sp. Root274]|uniref:type II toxin-antitoxin system YhaV family toxin n=1 Tax=unclassified Rhizobium TaxID=2613769 RepID=UPI00071287D6|nr:MULTISPECIES: type II toxin-antitoxin system YhaV family toxin [unclassified Rhizobium]KQW31126.1 toxin [Rhizobium sp. Root1240]KRD32673.1 toxin [Rhizobium sp. Root274]
METVNGWIIRAHPLFLDQLERLTVAVEREAQKRPETYRSGANVKLLAALQKLVFETIPTDPASPIFRAGGTLGPERRHWFRAKFGNGRFRLFFRYSSTAKIIVLAWVNEAETLRSYGAKTDAYAVFRSMLEDGNPPEGWTQLLEAASKEASLKRFARASKAGKMRDEDDI